MAIRKVGDCRILGALGKGGMATVYRAIHESLQREVAVKELPPEGSKSAEALSRFKREAMALAGFRHQHIVTLYDLIEKNDGWYMVMELVDGPTLADLIKEAPLPPEAVAVLGLQLASALEHAHFHRVVHRDLKPGNVMLSTWGDAKLMDFGIVQTEELDRLTKTGMAVGTPAYMSPEQVTGAPVDARSDIYSLGVVLYEALSGKRPYTGSNPGEVFARVTTGKRDSLKKAAPKAPKALREVIEKAMAVKAEERYLDATQLRRAFESLLSGLDSSPSAVLVNFLRKRNRLTESEAMARLSRTQLTQLSQLSPAELATVRGPRWGLGIFLGVVLGTVVVTRELWWPFVTRWLVSLGVPVG
ncbi:MAG: hypothetical protein AMXMBFR34_36840 [Myxococcaceae bacterium]